MIAIHVNRSPPSKRTTWADTGPSHHDCRFQTVVITARTLLDQVAHSCATETDFEHRAVPSWDNAWSCTPTHTNRRCPKLSESCLTLYTQPGTATTSVLHSSPTVRLVGPTTHIWGRTTSAMLTREGFVCRHPDNSLTSRITLALSADSTSRDRSSADYHNTKYNTMFQIR